MTLNDYLNKKKEFEFYILNINKNNNDYQDIIDVFLEGIVNAYVFESNNYTIVVSNVINPDVNQIVSAIIEDFGYKLKVFKSNKISTEYFEDFRLDTLEYTSYAIEYLPHWLLCDLADYLIQLTALKQKISSEIESVSMEADVTLMTKYSGLKWVKYDNKRV